MATAELAVTSRLSKPGRISSEEVEVTPRMAEQWLDQNLDTEYLKNRRVSDKTVASYAKDMAAGRWALNGESIKFSSDGHLVDGQHRLFACIEANTPFRTVVVKGVPREAFDTLDSGKKRTLADVLSSRRETDASHLATALNHLYRYLNNTFVNRGGGGQPTKREGEALLAQHPDLRDHIKLGRTLGGSFRIPGLWIMLSYLMYQKSPEMHGWFTNALLNGTDMKEGDAVLLLRDRLKANYNASRAKRLDTIDMAALTIKAWNYHREDQSIKLLKWNREGNEPFPRIK